MTLWIRRGMRLDVELAVALEFGVVRLQKAVGETDQAEALAFNQRLWAAIRRLVATAPEVDYREPLRQSAAIALGADAATLVAHNGRHARVLAGKAATGGALKRLLDDWRACRRQDPQADFGGWLLARMDCDAAPISVW